MTMHSVTGTVARATAGLALLVAALLLLGAAPAHAKVGHIAGIVRDVPTGSTGTAVVQIHARIATAHARGVGVHVRISHELIDDLLLSLPIIAKAAQVGDNEIDRRVLWGEHLDDRRLINHVHQ